MMGGLATRARESHSLWLAVSHTGRLPVRAWARARVLVAGLGGENHDSKIAAFDDDRAIGGTYLAHRF